MGRQRSSKVTRHANSSRCFLALTPAREVAVAIDAWRVRNWGGHGRPVPPENLHLTLAFLGELTMARIDSVVDAFDPRDVPPVSFVLDDVGWFLDSGVGWLGPKTASPAVDRLAELARIVARRCDIGIDKRSFRAHLTLLRRATTPLPEPLERPDIPFEATSVELYVSSLERDGARYREIANWPLAG